MTQLTLNQFRATHAAGGFTGAQLIGVGCRFYITATAITGDPVVLALDANRKTRFFSTVETGLKLLRDVGFASVTVEISQWAPEQGALRLTESRPAQRRTTATP